jgi:hypothetical protein
MSRPPPLLPLWSPYPTFHPSTPLAYADVYMDDFIGLAQGHPGLRDRVRSVLMHSIDSVFRPLHPTEVNSTRKEPISIKKLQKGDARWTTRHTILGWIIDTVAQTIELPLHRAQRLIEILTHLATRKRISLSSWQQQIGELRSMVLALPGGRGLFSTLYTGLTHPNHRVRITKPLRDAILDLHQLASDLGSRPTRLGEIVDSPPIAYGAADASGSGMGGVWLSPNQNLPPFLWRLAFPTEVQASLVSTDHPHGTITNSDLELTAQVASLDLMVSNFDCRETTLATFTDNVSTRAWMRKGSHTTLGPSAYLLRLLSLHQRHHRYRSTCDYIPGPINVMADDASRRWDLSDAALLSHFNLCYPQAKSWIMLTLRPDMASALITALHCKRSAPELYLPAPIPVMQPGCSGQPIAIVSPSTQCSPMSEIHFHSSKSLPNATDKVPLLPITNLSDLVRWKQPSAPLPRRWPAWGPRTHGSTQMATSTMPCSNNFEGIPAPTILQHV